MEDGRVVRNITQLKEIVHEDVAWLVNLPENVYARLGELCKCGAMAFRAQGGEKTGFSPTGAWVEPLSMRTSEQGRAMYGKMTDAQVATSLERAGNLNLGNVQSHWDSLGIPQNVSDPWMQTLQARQQQIPTLVSELRATKSK